MLENGIYNIFRNKERRRKVPLMFFDVKVVSER